MICPIMSKDDLDTSNCRTDCKWYLDGDCAITVLAVTVANATQLGINDDDEA